MSPEYQHLQSQAKQLYRQFNDRLDDKAAASSLASDIRNIVEQFEMSKNPHSIEDTIKRVSEQLKSLRSEGSAVMDPRHLDELRDQYEELRQEVRELSNY